MEPGFKESERQQELLKKERKKIEIHAEILRATDQLKDAKRRQMSAYSPASWIPTIQRLEYEIEDLKHEQWLLRDKEKTL